MKREDPAVRDLPSPPAGDRPAIERIAVDDLDSSFAWLQTVASSTVIGLFVHDFERLIWVNRAVEWMTGYERHELLDCLFAVSAADGTVTLDEEGQIWQTASELGFTHDEYIAVRLKYSDKRSVMR